MKFCELYRGNVISSTVEIEGQTAKVDTVPVSKRQAIQYITYTFLQGAGEEIQRVVGASVHYGTLEALVGHYKARKEIEKQLQPV